MRSRRRSNHSVSTIAVKLALPSRHERTIFLERRGLPRRPGVYAEGNDPIYIEDFNVNSQPNTLADIVRRELSECGLSQRAAARELGIDERIMRRYCSGDLEPPAYVLLAMQQLVQVELNRQVIQMLDDGSMSTSDGNATRERFANNNETLLQAMRASRTR